MTREFRLKGICILAGILVCLYLIYPTIRWSLYTDDQREKLMEQWKEEGDQVRPEGFGANFSFSMKKWWEGDRDKVINLGLDLQGGMFVVLEVQRDDAIRVQNQNIRERIKDSLANQNIEFDHVSEIANHGIEVGLSNNAVAIDALKVIRASADVATMLNLPENVSGSNITARMKAGEIGNIERRALEQAKYVVENRINQLGLSEPNIQVQQPNRVIVQLPGEKDPARVLKLIKQTAKLEFHLLASDSVTTRFIDRIDTIKRIKDRLDIENLSTEEGVRYRAYKISDADSGFFEKLMAMPEVQQRVPANCVLMLGRPIPEDRGGVYREFALVEKDVAIDGMSLKDARVTVQDSANNRVVSLSLDRQGGKRLNTVSAKAAYRYKEDRIVSRLAILLDESIYSSPLLLEHISKGEAVIRGRFSERDAADLALVLRSGALPAKLEVVQNRTVGASLGNDSIRKGIISGLLGAFFVILFITSYYLLAGVVADVALVLNVLMLLSILAFFRATLTLPGIAGIILTIGMAVDANVLIYERIREELAAGKALKQAVKDGFGRAWVVILDGHVTAIMTAVILYWLGTGPVKGFGLTLVIGLVVNLLTAVFVCRYVFDVLVARNTITTLPMFQLFKRPNLDVMGARYYCISGSIIVITLGMVVFGIRYANQNKALAEGKVQRGESLLHKPIKGIELTGGDVVRVEFTNVVEISMVREALTKIGMGDSTIQYLDKQNQVMIRSGFNTSSNAVAALRATFAGNPLSVLEEDRIGPAVGKELVFWATVSIVVSIILIVIYLWYRFEFEYGVGAMVATVHDVLIVLGCFAITGRQISLTVIAALLTIVGYSVNDTIVVFDRIREDLKLGKGTMKFEDLVNLAVNQTLSRTILTSATVIMVVLAQYLWGGEVINDFAFALLVGVITGTFSSVYIASPYVLFWNKLVRKGK